ncbi:MAG TPA: hypothetical protein VMR74_13830 [Gammaproteobacteria bacterium]|nr:hypothetical protein [Gammaproteobacteria bacterium]
MRSGVMLRGIEEHELIVSLEYQGSGTVEVDGEPCTLTRYRASTNYQMPGQRIQYWCRLPSGEEHSNVEVVSGRFAWDEDIPGAEIVPGEGTVTPMPDAVDERLIRLWASPQGAPKAALAGAGLDPLAMDRNLGGLLEAGTATIGETSLAWEDGGPAITYPIPGVDGATAVATLDDRFMTERVVVMHGSTTTEFDYRDYNDWNNPLNRIEVYYPGRITETQNGDVVSDLTTVETETGSVYVVVPVPASVGDAQWSQTFASDRAVTLTSDAPTPRVADGKPDLTGNWNSRGMNWRYGNRRCSPTQLEGCSPAWNQTVDFEFEAPSRFGPNRPVYRPEHWDRVQYLDMWTNLEDPVMTCQPLGIPRQLNPRRIYHTLNDIALIYGNGGDGGGGYSDMRFAPTNGREHDERQVIQTRYTGHTVGHWEDDTLVLDSIGFVDRTWLARGGFFHSHEMRVIERLTRQGNQILYEITVEDPLVLAEPWVMTPRIWELGDNPDAGLLPDRGYCEIYELDSITNQIRH